MKGYEVELRDYIRGLWGEKWIILAVFVVVVGSAVGVSLGLPEQYATKTTLLIAPRVSEQLTAENEPFVGTFSAETYKNLALANDLLQDIIQALDLRANPRRADSKPLAVESLKRQMRAEVAVGAGRFPLLTMTVRGTDPERINRIANKWAELFVQRNIRLLETALAQSYEFINERFAEINEALKAKEEEKKLYQQENPLELLESDLWVLRYRYEDFLSQLQDKRLELQEKRAQLTRLEKAFAEEPLFLELKRSISTEALWELLSRKPDPQLLAALTNLSLTEQQINQVYLSLKDQLIQARTEASTLESVIPYLEEQVQQFERQIEQKVAELAEVRLKGEQMDREIESLRQTFDNLFNRLQEARIAKAESESSIRVVESAITPQVPIGPRKLLIVAVAVVLGLFLGALLTFFKQYMASKPRPAKNEDEKGE